MTSKFTFVKRMAFCLGSFTLAALIALFFVGGANAQQKDGIEPQAEIVTNGTCGTCSWTIDSDGLLEIFPTDGVSGTLAGRPWKSSSEIVSVFVAEGVSAGANLDYMFSGCRSLKTADLSNLNTAKTTSMDCMFNDCSSLVDINLSNMDTYGVTSMECMFYGCSSLTSIDLSNLDTSWLKDIDGIFEGCTSLVSVNLSGLDFSTVTYMNNMFENCSSLSSFDFSEIKHLKPAQMKGIFSGCAALEKLNLSGLDTSRAVMMSNVFYGCSQLTEVRLDEGFSFYGDRGWVQCALPAGFWRSASTGSTLTPKQIAEQRSGLADTYSLQSRYSLADAAIEPIATVTYTGRELTPTVSVSYDNVKLIKDVDYSISYEANIDAGVAKAVVVGEGSYIGAQSIEFNILPASIGSFSIELDQKWLLYDGSPQKPSVVIKRSMGNALIEGKDYEIAWPEDVINAGTKQISVKGKGNYKGSLQASYEIYVPANPEKDIGSAVFDQTRLSYDGTPKKPSVTVRSGTDKTLKEGADYEIIWPDDLISCGRKDVEIVGINGYSGRLWLSYEIERGGTISSVTLVQTSFVYDGHSKRPEVIVKCGEYVLSEGNDYFVVWPDDTVSVGMKTISIVTGPNPNYTGELKAEYEITPAPSSDPDPAPDPAPNPNPAPMPDPEPTPDPGPTPAPEPGPDPVPEPTPEVPTLSHSDMYRLYNPNSGEHFYTASTVERDHLIGVGWQDEGVGWKAPDKGEPVYRLYNSNYPGEHHYTFSEIERDYLISIGWNDEGIGWYSDSMQNVPLYRAYNPNAYANNHHYTTDYGEFATLLSIGWLDEGVGWYGV